MPATEGPLLVADLQSSVIGYSKLNTLPSGPSGIDRATITLSTTGGSGNITNVEVGLSPCPGDISYGQPLLPLPAGQNNQQRFGYNPCYTSSPFITNVLVNWSVVNGTYYYCLAPRTETWYVNIRYTGSGRMFFQWNRR
jgi:hypothetical protein